MATDNDQELEERLRQHSTFFTSMVRLIPAGKFKSPEEEVDHHPLKYSRNKKNKAPKQAIKEASKRAKRLRLDPSVQEGSEKKQSTSESDQDRVEFQLSENQFTEQVQGKCSVEGVKSKTLPELRERLRNRITELQRKRKMPVSDCTNDKDRPPKKRRKRERKHVSQTRATEQTNAKQARPSIIDKGKVVFSKFDFTAPLAETHTSTKKKDYKKLLAKAEARQKKLEELTLLDLNKGQEIEEQLRWREAMGKAEGRKSRDNPALLKKTLKQIDKRKLNSKKKWEQRSEEQQRQKDKRQEIRQKHIQERIDQAKAKGGSRKKKSKGSVRRPGF